MRRILLTTACLGLAGLPTTAQTHHAELVGQLQLAGGGNHADVWAEGDYAYVGRFLQARVDIVDISDPANPTLATFWQVPSPNDTASAQDVKVENGLMFIALENNDPHGVEIVDVRDPLNPAHLTWIDTEPGEFEQIHNVYIADGWLYMDNSADNTVSVLDLRNYDPDSPPAEITSWTYRLDDVADIFVHDITVANGLLFCAAWNALYVYDVSNLASGPPVFVTATPTNNCHSVWTTEDGEYVVTASERQAGPLRLYQLDTSGQIPLLVQRDSWLEPLASAFCVHNPIVLNDRVYASYYQAGGIVLEIDRTTSTFMEVARFKTNTLTGFDGTFGTPYAGAWGIYPLDGEKRTLISDFGTGLSIVDFSALSFRFQSERPLDFLPGQETVLDVEVVGLDATLNAGTVSLAISVDGRPFVSLPMHGLGNGVFRGVFPPFNRGADVRWYVRASTTDGRIFQHPLGAPSVTHRGIAIDAKSSLFSDDFESNQGWDIVDAPTGSWVRDTPNSVYSQPFAGSPLGTGTRAMVTGAFGPVAGTDDVDDGTTVLTSPPITLNGRDGRVSFDRWYFSSDADPDDGLLIQIQSDSGPWVTVDEIEYSAGGWVRESFVISDHVSPGNTMRLRFSVADDPNDSIVDACIDEVLVERFDETPGVVLSIDPVSRGQSTRWRVTGGNPGEFVATIYSLAGTGNGPCFFGGNVCVDLLLPFQLLDLSTLDTEGAFELAVVAPGNSGGLTVSGQAVVLRGLGFVDSETSNPATVTIQ